MSDDEGNQYQIHTLGFCENNQFNRNATFVPWEILKPEEPTINIDNRNNLNNKKFDT